jgi:hypothetical protein
MLILCVNCMTWVRRYTRKALLDQRPMSMMVYTGTPAMCIAMAAAERIEWVPQSSGLKPRRSVPMSATAFWMRVVISFPVTCVHFPGLPGVGLVAGWKSEHTGVFLVEPGKFLIDLTMAAHARTGQSILWPVQYIVIVASLRSVF